LTVAYKKTNSSLTKFMLDSLSIKEQGELIHIQGLLLDWIQWSPAEESMGNAPNNRA